MSQRTVEDCFISFDRAVALATAAIEALSLDDEDAVLAVVNEIHANAKIDFLATGNAKTSAAV